MTATNPSISATRGISGPVSGGVGAMALSALGVVFGDIGTSPLYTLKTVLGVNGTQALDRAIALGSLSLIFWTLIIITSIKYVAVAIPKSWKEAHQRALSGETVREEQDPFPRGDGRLQWRRWEMPPWRGSNGTIGGILIFSEDVTARVEMERALRESREDFGPRAGRPHGSWRLDVNSNELTWFAPKASKSGEGRYDCGSHINEADQQEGRREPFIFREIPVIALDTSSGAFDRFGSR